MAASGTGTRDGRSVLVGHRVVTGALERDHDLAWPGFLTLLDRLLAAGSTFAGNLDADPRDGAAVLTFDDGTDDHGAVAQELAAREVPAVFFVSAGLLGMPGHLDAPSVRELIDG